MKRFLSFFALLLVVSSMFVVAPSAKAEETCTCFCGIKAKGATPLEGTYQTNSACEASCDRVGGVFSVCAKESSQMPLANGICWSQEDCTASNNGQWGTEQPAECAPRDHFCYPPAKPVELAVHIGETTQVYNIGTYINLMYTYGLGAAAIFAIVMIMIGGVQYMIGSGTGGEAVTAAKTRITNAVTGLVLLLLVYVILYTVNPSLTIFKTVEMPRIKPSLFIVGSCEDYKAKDYKVSLQAGEKSETCGNKGTITEDANHIDISQSCIYDTCGAGEQCVVIKDEYTCRSCADMNAEAAEQGFKVTDANCSALTAKPDPSQPNEFNLCMVVQDTAFFDFDHDICADVTVDCSSMISCWDYGAQRVNNFDQLATNEAYDSALFKLCTQNPCKTKVGSCTPINVEEWSGFFGVTYTVAMLDNYFKANPDEKISSAYVMTAGELASIFKSIQGTTFSWGSGDVGCAPSELIE